MFYTLNYKTPGKLTHVPHAKQILVFTTLAERPWGAKTQNSPSCGPDAQPSGKVPASPHKNVTTFSAAGTRGSHMVPTPKANALFSLLKNKLKK